MGLKINSYCIFGNSYWGVMPLLLRVHFSIFPKNYQLRIYHDTSFEDIPYRNVLLHLNKIGLVKTIFVNEPVLKCRAMLWRMIPVWDSDVDFVFCKDADSIPTPREYKIMEEFIGSGKPVLGINDNPGHCIPLMGGMIGFNTKEFIRASGIQTFGDFMRLGPVSDSDWCCHGKDQYYLSDYVLPRIKNEMLLYRTFDGATDLKNIRCIKKVPNIKLNHTNEHILRLGDRCISYMGASGLAGPLNVDLYNDLGSLGCNTIFEFFDKFGNQEINNIIRTEESKEKRLKEENWI